MKLKNYYNCTFYQVFVSPPKVTVWGATSTSPFIQCWLDTLAAGIHWQATLAGCQSLRRGSHTIIYSHTLNKVEHLLPIGRTPSIACIISGDTTQKVSWNIQQPPKIKFPGYQMFLCMSTRESRVGRQERKECILRKINWLETGRPCKQPQTNPSRQGLFKQREQLFPSSSPSGEGHF